MSTHNTNRYDVIDNYFSEIVDLQRFVRTLEHGFESAYELVSVTNSIHEIGKLLKQDDLLVDEERRKEEAEEIEKFSKEQRSLSHPYLYGTALIRAWSIIEAFIDDIVLSRLKVCGVVAFNGISSTRISVRIEDFAHMNEEDRLDLVLAKFKERCNSDLKKGGGRFKVILKEVAIDGSTPEWVDRLLLEMAEIRNCFVHRKGLVDKRLLSSCPWIDLKQGDHVSIGSEGFRKYWLTSMWYVVNMKIRLYEAYGEIAPRGEEWRGVLSFYEERILENKARRLEQLSE